MDRFFLTLLVTALLLPVITPGSSIQENRDATTRNLLEAYRFETTACAKYAAYAWKARQEGLNEIALLFSAVSNSEHIHARSHSAVLRANGIPLPDIRPRFPVGSTMENLENSISGETGEVGELYPEFMAVASREGDKKSLESFNHAYKAEIKHKGFFEAALTALRTGKSDELPGVYSVCQVCGNTYDEEPPETCAICTSPRERFLTVLPF